MAGRQKRPARRTGEVSRLPGRKTVVPGGEIVVNRDHDLDHAHEDVFVAMRDAFAAAARRLEDHRPTGASSCRHMTIATSFMHRPTSCP
jgi:hypothetical protein